MTAVGKLTTAAYGIHLADQLSLVATPLVGTVVFEASPTTLGLLVAFQSVPHLIGSLPSGVLVDRYRPEVVARTSAGVSTVAFLLLSLLVGMGTVHWFAPVLLISGLGVVVFGLAALSVVPRIAGSGLAYANARIEIPRAVAGVVAPLVVGLLIKLDLTLMTFVVASAAAAVAFVSLARLTRSTRSTGFRSIPRGRLKEAMRMVATHGLLRPIALVSVFWNAAFAALLVVAVLFLTEDLGRAPAAFGVGMSSFGVGAVAGTSTMRLASNRIQPRTILMFGPASSVVAATTLLSLPFNVSIVPIVLCFFVLGFGPSMWLVAQNTIRQAVTPSDLLGSVNAVIQTGIYGSRPVGAALGGLLLAGISPRGVITAVAFLFVGSTVIAAFSGLRNVQSFEDLNFSVLPERVE